MSLLFVYGINRFSHDSAQVADKKLMFISVHPKQRKFI